MAPAFVYDDVRRADCFHKLLDVRAVGNVQGVKANTVLFGPRDLRSRGAQVVQTSRYHVNNASFRMQCIGNALADAGGGAGHKRCLSSQSKVHILTLSRCVPN